MASTTAPYNSEQHIGPGRLVPLAASTEIHPGNLVAITVATGHATGASDTAGTRVVGRATQHVNNTGAAAAESIEVVRGLFAFENDVTNPIAVTHVGDLCYVKDPKTVQNSSATNDIPVGRVFGFTSSGKVIVDVCAA